MGDLKTDLLTKNSLGYLDNLIKDLIKASESISKDYVVKAKKSILDESLQVSLQKYYETTQKPEGVPTAKPVSTYEPPEYKVSAPPSQIEEDLLPGEREEKAFGLGKVAGVGAAGLTGAVVSQYTPDGTNGKLRQDQLTSVGTLSGSPEGGPYWYGRTAYLRPDAAQAFLRAKQDANKAGITIIINSAYRSLEHQKALQGKYAVVATPGASPHGAGIALDIELGAGHDWMKKNGMKYGWKWMAIPNDDVHFEYVGGGSSKVDVKKPEKNIPQQLSSAGKNRQLIAVVNNQSQVTQNQQVASTAPSTSLNKNYSNFTEVLLTHTTFNVG